MKLSVNLLFLKSDLSSSMHFKIYIYIGSWFILALKDPNDFHFKIDTADSFEWLKKEMIFKNEKEKSSVWSATYSTAYISFSQEIWKCGSCYLKLPITNQWSSLQTSGKGLKSFGENLILIKNFLRTYMIYVTSPNYRVYAQWKCQWNASKFSIFHI